MELNYWKDCLFDVLNEGSDKLKILDMEAHDKKNTVTIITEDGSQFELKCRKLPDRATSMDKRIHRIEKNLLCSCAPWEHPSKK